VVSSVLNVRRVTLSWTESMVRVTGIFERPAMTS